MKDPILHSKKLIEKIVYQGLYEQKVKNFDMIVFLSQRTVTNEICTKSLKNNLRAAENLVFATNNGSAVSRMCHKDLVQFHTNDNSFRLSQTDVDNDLIGDPCDTNKDRYRVTSSITSHIFVFNDLCNERTGDQNLHVPVKASLVQ